jgi:hypothetical protein
MHEMETRLVGIGGLYFNCGGKARENLLQGEQQIAGGRMKGGGWGEVMRRTSGIE